MSKLFFKRISFATVILLCVFSFGLVFFASQNNSTVAYASELERPQTATLNFYVKDEESLAITDNLDSFLSKTADDVKIEVV